MMAAKTEAPQGKAGFLVLKECLSSLPTETATDGDDSREGQQGREQTAGRGQGQTAAAEWRGTGGGRGNGWGRVKEGSKCSSSHAR